MYGRGNNTIAVMLCSFAAGWLFATFFNVTPKDDSPLTQPNATQRRAG